MADFPYTTVPGKIGTLFAKIREVGVPQKVTQQWLKSVGFKSSNDASLVGVLKYIGFIDGSAVPTLKWTQYRGDNSKTRSAFRTFGCHRATQVVTTNWTTGARDAHAP